MHPAFVPFIEQTARYLAGNERQGGARPVDAYLELAQRASEQGARRSRSRIPRASVLSRSSEAASAQSFQVTEAGYYQLRLADGRQDEVGVNADPKESNLDVIPADVLSLWQGGQGSQDVAAAGSATPQGSQPVKAPPKSPESLWWYVMLLVLASAVAESVLASRYLGTLREENEPLSKAGLGSTQRAG